MPAFTHCTDAVAAGQRPQEAKGRDSRGKAHGAALLTYLGVAPQEAIRDGDVDVEGQRLQDSDLGGQQLLLLVGVVADVEEVVDAGGTALLRRGRGGCTESTSLLHE